jgi:hypothetical protein
LSKVQLLFFLLSEFEDSKAHQTTKVQENMVSYTIFKHPKDKKSAKVSPCITPLLNLSVQSTE